MKHSRSIPAKTATSGWVTGILALLIACGNAQAYDLRGHFKPQATVANIPAGSALQEFIDDPAVDSGLDLRLNFSGGAANWSWHSDYQLLARQGDQLELLQQNSIPGFGGAPVVDDDHRVLDLSRRISDRDDRVIAHRLDRFYLSRTTDKTVFNIGRQAVTWGNGIIYNPVDFFNPFDPAAIDTEYKTGDDMLYAQYLLDSGNDVQSVWVGRRDDDGHVSSDATSLALKYHIFSGSSELDLLVADHYDARIGAVGGSVDIADAIWRSDLMLTDSNGEQFTSAVLSWSYALLAWERNLSTTIEYFHNGFGIDDGNYDPLALAANPELVARIERGELFTLAQNYLAAAATIELTPLWLLTTSVFRNLDDDSTLLQVFSRHDLQQDLQLLLALNLPHGDDGTEFGGIDSDISENPLSVGASLFAQLAWYF
ncbi:MAG: hypothetical protein GY815_11620 [Gammaproteobacteria bacterium]|nr:hypothetical protein [Gammaproteobacteria bacterium]